MESIKECNNTAVVAVEIKDDMEAPNNHKDINNKDIKDENLDVISDTVGETLNIEDCSIVSADQRTQNSSSKPSSSCFSRLCCCFNDCTKQKFLVIAIHFFIIIIALLCLIPSRVMKEVMRARMANIATLVWIIYCIIMISINISYYFHRRKHMSKSSHEEEVIDVEEDISKSQEEVDVEEQTSYNYRVASTCNKMGCLCFTNGLYISSSNTSKCCFKKATCYKVVIALLIIEGILLLSPVFASLSTYNSIDVELDNAFPEVLAYPPPDPKNKAFSFGNYLLPGGFSMNGGYTNQNDNVKTFKYQIFVPELSARS